MKKILFILSLALTINATAQKDYNHLNVTRERAFKTTAKIFIEPIVADYVLAVPLLKSSLQGQGFTVVDDKLKAEYSIAFEYKSRNDRGCDGRVMKRMNGVVTDIKNNFDVAKFSFGQISLEGKCTKDVMNTLAFRLKTGEK